MPKFVIQYEWDGGDNAENLLAVNCLEYESLEKLEEDFKQFVLSEAKNRWQKGGGVFRRIFANNSFNIEQMFCSYSDGYTYYKPVILPLEEWFEYQKEQGKLEGR